LTGATEIFGEDRLFATLDTTLHHTLLPSKCSIFLADTIGFISDLPMNLIASFEATLRHVINADLLIHIEDLSHPDIEAQRANVMQTLRDLKVRDELIDSMIHISNKIDKLAPEKLESLRASSNDNNVFVSCRTGFGLTKLVNHLDTVRSLSVNIFEILLLDRSSNFGHKNTGLSIKARVTVSLLFVQ
jgi:GTP-binding protein HflX